MIDLAHVWAAIIAFAVLAYVVLDGFDLGVGILFPFLKNERERDYAMNSVAPVWDGNETWLVLGGGGLLAAFPLAYAIVLPALYMPITVMLLGLVFRGVAFEFRWRGEERKHVWDWSFAGGSAVAALCQGIALGALVQGIEIDGRAYGGGWWDWLSPFTVLTGVSLVIGYAMLGATWLVMKTGGDLQGRASRMARSSLIATMVALGAVCLATPFLNEAYSARWFTWPGLAFAIALPLLALTAAYLLLSGLANGRDRQPFLAALAIFVAAYTGIGVSLYPNIVPPALTIVDAASPDASLAFLLAGTTVLLPLILGYTAYAYWVFRGKTKATEHYH